MISCTKGLDAVEFVMAVEDAFSISIPDRDAEKLKTLEDLFRYVRHRVQPGSSADCMTAKVFYRLRRALMTLTGRLRTEIRPDTLLEDVVPRSSRSQQWPIFRQELGLDLPQLQMPNVVMLLGAVLLCGFFTSLVAGFTWGWFWLGCPVMLGGMVLLLRLARPYTTILHGCETLGDLARIVWAKNFSRLHEPGASDEQIWQAIVCLLSNCAGIEPSDITRDLRFTDIPGDL